MRQVSTYNKKQNYIYFSTTVNIKKTILASFSFTLWTNKCSLFFQRVAWLVFTWK